MTGLLRRKVRCWSMIDATRVGTKTCPPYLAALDVERLYLSRSDSRQALMLIPLVRVGSSPQSAKNACYFFSRLDERDSARFGSYHFADKPELIGQFDDATAAIKFLTAI